MSWLLDSIARTLGRVLGRSLEVAAANPREAQLKQLRQFIKKGANTAFGRDHHFHEIQTPEDYRARVPIRDYEGLRPYVTRMLNGEKAVLTHDEPFMFTTTSGTTDKPKLIPVTKRWRKELSKLVRIWLYRAMRDHPGTLQDGLVSLVSPAVEAHTAGGMPIGSVSGLTYQRVPWLVRKKYLVPYGAITLQDYDLRYLVATRYALARRASVAIVPNPSTLLRIAQTGNREAESMIRSVRDGRLGFADLESLEAHDRGVIADLEKVLKPDPKRAKFMEQCISLHGVLRPKELWPNLRLIGCWLGCSCGIQAERLEQWYGQVAFRDIGYRATEATITVPFTDSCSEGMLALNDNYFEFIPEDEMEREEPTILLSHELELGKHYYILFTTRCGLYRYDINDIIEVRGFYRNAPLVAFLRKGRDMANITGEKIHVNQVCAAMRQASEELSIPWEQIQMIPDVDGCRYDLLFEPQEGNHSDQALTDLLERFDKHLMNINMEYATKRKSRRLHIPRFHEMAQGWATRRQREDVLKLGKRDGQYKWPYIRQDWSPETRQEVIKTLRDRDPATPDR
jgi:hypothetical protein